jgi:NifB/MoaA-like Fe-S oxidoreductase
VDTWQERFVDALGRRMVFAADEYYLMAGRPFPEAAEYEGFAQHENGIGMARTFEVEVLAAVAGRDSAGLPEAPHRGGFFAWVDGAPAEGYRSARQSAAVSLTLGRARPAGEVALITGRYGAQVLAPMLGVLSEVAGVPVRTLPVPNRLFGGNIAVTGLLAGADLAPVLAAEPEAGTRYVLPDVTLSKDLFLDGTSPADLPRPVQVVATDGHALVEALRAQP